MARAAPRWSWVPIPVSRGRLPAPVQSAAVRSDTRAPTAGGQKTRLLQPSPPSPPPGLCVPMLGGSGLYRGGGYWPPWGNGGNCQNFISRLEAEPTSRPSVQAPGRLEGQPVRWSGLFTAGHIGDLCRVTRSAMDMDLRPQAVRGHGLALSCLRFRNGSSHRPRGVIP